MIQIPVEYVLDTSVLIEALHQNASIIARLNQLQTLYIPSIAFGELYFGARHGNKQRIQESLTKVNDLMNLSTILNCDSVTARVYGELKEEQSAKGLMLPENDLWIAAIARQYALTLATRDAHFQSIANIFVEQW